MITAAQRQIPVFFWNQGHSIPDWANKEPSKIIYHPAFKLSQFTNDIHWLDI